MAKTGNHGQVIPRDYQLMFDLYWIKGNSTPKIAAMFDVEHKSIQNVLKELGIPLRGKGVRSADLCIDCKVVYPLKVPHPLTKNGTGTRCHECLKKYKREWTKTKKAQDPIAFRAKREEYMKQWYRFGPKQPIGEEQWISKARALLRTNRCLLKGTISREHLQSLNKVSEQVPTSQT